MAQSVTVPPLPAIPSGPAWLLSVCVGAAAIVRAALWLKHGINGPKSETAAIQTAAHDIIVAIEAQGVQTRQDMANAHVAAMALHVAMHETTRAKLERRSA